MYYNIKLNKHMSWYSVFYWISVADNVKNFFDTASDIFTFFTVISLLALFIARIGKSIQISESQTKNDDQDKVNPMMRAWESGANFASKLFYPMLILSLITWAFYSLTPTKKDCLMIVAGGAVGEFMQSDTSASSLPSDITAYLHMSLKKEISDLSVEDRQEIGVETDKDKLMDKVKDMSKEEIIKFIESQSDTSSVLNEMIEKI